MEKIWLHEQTKRTAFKQAAKSDCLMYQTQICLVFVWIKKKKKVKGIWCLQTQSKPHSHVKNDSADSQSWRSDLKTKLDVCSVNKTQDSQTWQRLCMATEACKLHKSSMCLTTHGMLKNLVTGKISKFFFIFWLIMIYMITLNWKLLLLTDV